MGAEIDPATSTGCFGWSSSAGPVRRPYQATPALTPGLCAEYSQTIRPPQQKPVIPSRATSALPVDFAQATVASRSDITWASGTFETTLKISWNSFGLNFETSPWRA